MYTVQLTPKSLIIAVVPLAVLVAWFVLIAVVNWDYEAKFFEVAMIQGERDPLIGFELFAAVGGFGVASSLFAFFASRHLAHNLRFQGVMSMIVSALLFIMALGFLVLGPALITMREQMPLVDASR